MRTTNTDFSGEKIRNRPKLLRNRKSKSAEVGCIYNPIETSRSRLKRITQAPITLLIREKSQGESTRTHQKSREGEEEQLTCAALLSDASSGSVYNAVGRGQASSSPSDRCLGRVGRWIRIGPSDSWAEIASVTRRSGGFWCVGVTNWSEVESGGDWKWPAALKQTRARIKKKKKQELERDLVTLPLSNY